MLPEWLKGGLLSIAGVAATMLFGLMALRLILMCREPLVDSWYFVPVIWLILLGWAGTAAGILGVITGLLYGPEPATPASPGLRQGLAEQAGNRRR